MRDKRLAAKCLDQAYAESPVDAGTFDRGVCRVVVNFDQDTRINGLVSSCTVDSGVCQREINFQDDVPDTVSYDSWLRLEYEGWDDSRDNPTCSPIDPDPMGDTVFDNLPGWLDEDLTFYLTGRDTGRYEGEFEQSIFINGNLSILNVFPAASLGCWTQEEVYTLRVTLVR